MMRGGGWQAAGPEARLDHLQRLAAAALRLNPDLDVGEAAVTPVAADDLGEDEGAAPGSTNRAASATNRAF
jgi:hypothetical protein